MIIEKIEMYSPDNKDFTIYFDSREGEVKVEGKFLTIEAFFSAIVLLSKEYDNQFSENIVEEKQNNVEVSLPVHNDSFQPKTNELKVYEIDGKNYVKNGDKLVLLDVDNDNVSKTNLTTVTKQETVNTELDNTIRKPLIIGDKTLMVTDYEKSLLSQPNQEVKPTSRPMPPNTSINNGLGGSTVSIIGTNESMNLLKQANIL